MTTGPVKRTPIKINLKSQKKQNLRNVVYIVDIPPRNIQENTIFLGLGSKMVGGLIPDLWIHVFGYLSQKDALPLSAIAKDFLIFIRLSRTSLDMMNFGSPYSVDTPGRAFSFLSNFIELKSLRLPRRLCLPVLCPRMEMISQLSKLTSLDLRMYHVDDQELTILASSLPNLLELCIHYVFPAVLHFSKLRSLVLSWSSSSSLLEPFGVQVMGWEMLVSLHLRGTCISDMSFLGNFPNLEELDMGSCKYSCGTHCFHGNGCTEVAIKWHWILLLRNLERLCLCNPCPIPAVSELVLFSQQSKLVHLCGMGWLDGMDVDSTWKISMKALYPELCFGGCCFSKEKLFY